jgi:hypothetical protein
LGIKARFYGENMIIHEPLSKETLYFEPDHYDDNISSQAVFVGCVEKSFVSVVFSKHYNDYRDSFSQIVFTTEEIDIFIKGLKEARERSINFVEDNTEE